MLEPERRQALLAEYAEVNSNFRLLTDIRFKLLAFIPLAVAAAVAAANVAGGGGGGSGAQVRLLALLLFGLAVSVALATYNARNDQIYVWLVQRGGQIERELGIFDGSFVHRPNTWFDVSAGPLHWPVGHAASIGGIYAAAIALWLGASLATGAQLAWGSADVPVAIYVLAGAVAVAVSVRGSVVVGRLRSERRKAIEKAGASAIERAGPFRTARGIEEFEGEAYDEFVGACCDLAGRDGRGDERREEVKRRIRFYARMGSAERLLHGLEQPPNPEADAQYVALLVGLPPRMLMKSPRRRL